MQTLQFGTKAETLARLSGQLRTAAVKKPYYFNVNAWRLDQDSIVADIMVRFSGLVVVRSSCIMEDTLSTSNAGRFLSISNVNASSAPALRSAVEQVIASYGIGADRGNHVLIQEHIADIVLCGVAFTRELTTLAPYYIVNYDQTGSNDAVTSGRGTHLSTYIRYRYKTPPKPIDRLERVIGALQEIEMLFDSSKLDIEFAVDSSDTLWILQVRPLANQQKGDNDSLVEQYLRKVYKKIEKLNGPHIDLLGDRTIFGVMPDWNPAEMIGTKPRPLSLSLYKELITDRVWAYQRDNYGYRNLRSHPLMVSFLGCPYIDTRVSFNSFVPKNLPDPIAQRIVNAYLDMLADHPQSHDKVEFDIVISCYHFNIEAKLQEVADRATLTNDERESFKQCVRDLTNNILKEKSGLFAEDLKRIDTLNERHDKVALSTMTSIEKIYWLMEDCKRYGTLPFAGIARAAFIAVQMMKSLVTTGVLLQEEYDAFMNSLSTVSKNLSRDFGRISSESDRTRFLKTYGHLRPGTYDIMSSRYDEAFNHYFGDSVVPAGLHPAEPAFPSFSFSPSAKAKITGLLFENGLECDAEHFLHFVKSAVEGREHAKFVFSRNISDVLSLLRGMGERYGITPDDMSYINISTITGLYSSLDALDLRDILLGDSARNRRAFEVTRLVRLPCLIRDAEDVYAFFLDETDSNFITSKRARGQVVKETELETNDLSKKVVFVTSADPGYDWLFSHNIGCLVTMYGGANSHMAIRAAELGLPAVIGCGEKNFRAWSSYNYIDVDCGNHLVQELHA